MEHNTTTEQQADQVEALKAQIADLKEKIAAGQPTTLPDASTDNLPANREEREAFVSQHVEGWLKNHRYASINPALQANYLKQYHEHMQKFFAAQELFGSPKRNSEAFRGAVSNRKASAELRMRNALRDMSAIEYKLRLGSWGMSSRELGEQYELEHLDLLPGWK